jgi:hypothetical protein
LPAIFKPLEASLMVAMFTALTATIIALKLVVWMPPGDHGKHSVPWRKPMPEPEPLSRSSSRFPRFLIGQDTCGRWVVQDQRGLSGGLFASRAEAIRYVMFESGRQPQAVIMVPGVLELDSTRGRATTWKEFCLIAGLPRRLCGRWRKSNSNSEKA